MHASRRAALCGIAAAFGALLAAPAAAQSNPWDPGRPVTIVVPYAAGGSVDAMARAVGKGITTAYGQPVVVENVGGAESLIGTRRVMDAKPDGYTLLIQVPALTVIQHLPNTKGVNPLQGLAPLTSIMESPVLIAGSAKVPAANLQEWVGYCQKAAQPCSTGSGEVLGRLRAQQIAAEAKLPNLVNVNYRGTTPALTDLVAGNIQMSFVNIPTVMGHLRNGTVRILAVQDKKRSPLLPDVPTTVEMGFPQFQMVSWFGLFAPAGTPVARLDAVAAALQKLRGDADFQKTVENAGSVMVLNKPAEFAQQVQSEERTWAELVRKYPLQQ
jgi:tripartite-type tricarboxylate transporter receptor subunit TctC